jgi:hypothetical protein
MSPRALVVKALHPTPPRAGGGDQELLLAQVVTAVGASPGQDHVEAVARLELMDAAQRPERPVATNVQIEILPTPCLYGQAARSCMR